jgi:ectoine hydroxylase-related dioxygenase (phytanoyl-CoA dioxygenase family)
MGGVTTKLAIKVTDEQKRSYEEEGYLLVRNLVPDDILTRAEAVIRRTLQNGAQPVQESKYGPIWQAPIEDPALVAVYQPEFIAVAAELAGEDPSTFAIPQGPWALVIFPQVREWVWPNPHIDHALKEDNFKIFPPPFRIATISYLTDVPPRGGGTILWPGSHKAIEALARSDSDRYRFMSDLNHKLREIFLGNPVEVTASRGDVLFYHYLCAHAPAMNTGNLPRLALGKKW